MLTLCQQLPRPLGVVSLPNTTHPRRPDPPIFLKHSSGKATSFLKTIQSSSRDKDKTPGPGSEAFLTERPTCLLIPPPTPSPTPADSDYFASLTPQLSPNHSWTMPSSSQPQESYHPSRYPIAASPRSLSTFQLWVLRPALTAVFLCHAPGLSTC